MRTVTGLVLGGISLLLMFLSRPLFSLEVLLITLYGLRELYNITNPNVVVRGLGFILAVVLAGASYWFDLQAFSLIGLIVVSLSLMVPLTLSVFALESEGKGKLLPPKSYLSYWRDSLVSLGAQVYVSLPFSFAIFLSREPEILLLLLLAVFSVDIFAFFVGRFMGRRIFKSGFFNSLSPRKTWEGTLGGITVAFVVSYFYVKLYFPRDLWWYLFIAFSSSVLASLSDLIESSLKRGFQIKDTDSVIFGHGGVLDRFDSYILPAWFFWWMLIFKVLWGWIR